VNPNQEHSHFSLCLIIGLSVLFVLLESFECRVLLFGDVGESGYTDNVSFQLSVLSTARGSCSCYNPKGRVIQSAQTKKNELLQFVRPKKSSLPNFTSTFIKVMYICCYMCFFQLQSMNDLNATWVGEASSSRDGRLVHIINLTCTTSNVVFLCLFQCFRLPSKYFPL